MNIRVGPLQPSPLKISFVLETCDLKEIVYSCLRMLHAEVPFDVPLCANMIWCGSYCVWLAMCGKSKLLDLKE